MAIIGRPINNRVGEINYNTKGSRMKIIECINARNIVVIFDNGYKTKTEYSQFKKGQIKNPYDKTIYNVGYIGEGYYKLITHKNIYKHWSSMIRRCYADNKNKFNPTYKDCSVCEEWHNFQNFGKWFDENYYTIENETMALDKDILVKGNKTYSPETCVFVPQRINSLFLKRNKSRGKYPIGTSYNKRDKKYESCCHMYKNNRYTRHAIGNFDTPTEAFNVYKTFKEQYIKQVANEYKEKIPKKLYDAMYRYEVEITD